MKSSRGNFSSKIGFILAAAGSAIGLGAIWRFPYLAGANGGALFLLLFLLCAFALCVPIMIGEIAIGRYANSDAYGSYVKLGGKKWGYVGLVGIVIGVLILSFYHVVAGWAFGYFLEIVFGNLLSVSNHGEFFGRFVEDVPLNIFLTLAFTSMTAFIVSQGIHKGVERANKIMMPLLFLLLIGLIIYALTLPNAMAGVQKYIVPDFSEITLPTFFEALKQAFFSLSLGMGCMMTYGSYLTKQQDIVESTLVITVADMAVAFLAGLMIFPFVAALGAYDVQGPSLVFVILANVFSSMGMVVGKIVGGSFFLLLCFAALTSTISLLEVPIAFFVDQKKLSRKKMSWAVSLVMFLLSMPSLLSQGSHSIFHSLPFYQGKDFLTLISDLCDVSLTVGGCVMSIFISKIWRIENFEKEILQGSKPTFFTRYVSWTIRYICPWLLGILSVLIVVDKFYGIKNIVY